MENIDGAYFKLASLQQQPHVHNTWIL
jgi:hypothetical protein